MHQAIYPHSHAIPNFKSNKFIVLPKPALIPFHTPTPCENSTPSVVHWESRSYLILRRHLHNSSFPWVKHHIHLSNNAKLKELKFLKQTRVASLTSQTSQTASCFWTVWSVLGTLNNSDSTPNPPSPPQPQFFPSWERISPSLLPNSWSFQLNHSKLSGHSSRPI